MTASRVIRARIPDALERQARSAHPELATFDISRLVRVGLALAAGNALPDAIEASRGNKRGPKPKAGAAA
jgi:hypothetical protein